MGADKRNSFHLKPLPVPLGEEVIKRTREFLAFLEQSGASTHPDVRQIQNTVSLHLAALVGQVEASKVVEAGGAQDEIDTWLDNGIQGVK
jgi:hypothetical protein